MKTGKVKEDKKGKNVERLQREEIINELRKRQRLARKEGRKERKKRGTGNKAEKKTKNE